MMTKKIRPTNPEAKVKTESRNAELARTTARKTMGHTWSRKMARKTMGRNWG